MRVLGTFRLSACGSASCHRGSRGSTLGSSHLRRSRRRARATRAGRRFACRCGALPTASGRVFGYCLSRLGRREDAEDAVQTTFLHAVRGLRRGVVPATEIAWLLGIARNVCLTRWESVGRRSRLEFRRPGQARPRTRRAAGPARRADRARGRSVATARATAPRGPAARLARALVRRGRSAARCQPRGGRDPHLPRPPDACGLLREEPQATRRRLRSLGDLGSLLSAVKAVLTGGAAATKIAATAVTVAARRAPGQWSARRSRAAEPPRPTLPLRSPQRAASVASVALARSARSAAASAVVPHKKRRRHALPPRLAPRSDRCAAGDCRERSAAATPAGEAATPTPSSSSRAAPRKRLRHSRGRSRRSAGEGVATGRDRSRGGNRRAAAADPAR